MTDSAYSPRLRTAVLLCGTGTAGVYQAGVLKALAEAGVKVDIVAGHGPGVGNALCGAIEGGARLWDESGPWASRALRRAYTWRTAIRIFFFGLGLSAFVLVSPTLVLSVAAIVYALGMLASLVSLPAVSEQLVLAYQRMIELLFDPPILPTIVPRAVVLTLLISLAVLVVAAVKAASEERSRHRLRGGFWWRLIGAPLGGDEPGNALSHALWKLVRTASGGPAPAIDDIGRRYAEVLTDNLGQPGFREIIVAVHDLDARRDLVGALLAPHGRGRFEARRGGSGSRDAEIVDFTGPERDLIVDFVMGGTRLPVATRPWSVEFPTDAYWRGERHHFCDRPELPLRLVDEIAAVGAEQIILVSPAPPAAVPHGLRPAPASFRARIGAEVRSIETAAFDVACAAAKSRVAGVFTIRPVHNPIGPFDFTGTYDEASDRPVSLADLMQQGYSDAYRFFIDPSVAAGDPIESSGTAERFGTRD